MGLWFKHEKNKSHLDIIGKYSGSDEVWFKTRSQIQKSFLHWLSQSFIDFFCRVVSVVVCLPCGYCLLTKNFYQINPIGVRNVPPSTRSSFISNKTIQNINEEQYVACLLRCMDEMIYASHWRMEFRTNRR